MTLSVFSTHADLEQLNPVRASIARISDEELWRMSAADLVDLLTYSPLRSSWAELSRELPDPGRSGLRILALLARRRCRDEITDLCRRRGRPTPQFDATSIPDDPEETLCTRRLKTDRHLAELT